MPDSMKYSKLSSNQWLVVNQLYQLDSIPARSYLTNPITLQDFHNQINRNMSDGTLKLSKKMDSIWLFLVQLPFIYQ